MTIRVILHLIPVKDRSFLPKTRDHDASRRHKFVQTKSVSESTDVLFIILTMYIFRCDYRRSLEGATRKILWSMRSEYLPFLLLSPSSLISQQVRNSYESLLEI